MDQYIVLAAVSIALATHIIVAYRRERIYLRTIDRLTDKLMAKDYKEYTTLNAPVEPPKPQKPPMSWYDDPQDEEDSAH